ncbi:hypothetical protein CFP66_39850 [Pseudonocardia sp. MH-G8]|nr:hypothetical protein CFP66_39850 [Pseudonocardia sp. MH-G8]
MAVALAAFASVRAPSGGWFLGVAIIGLASGVAVRRVRPSAVFVGQSVMAAGAVLVGVPGDAVVIAVALALYPVASGVRAWPAAAAVGGASAAVFVPGFMTVVVPGLPVVAAPPGEESFASTPLSSLGYGVVVIGGSWALGRVLRARRADAEQLARLREQRAVGEERLRIGRDVHDILGHSLSVIAMKAAVAEHLAADRPEEGHAALSAIAQVSREALDDVRTVLTALREVDDTRAGLDDLPRLVANAEAAGLSVTLEQDGHRQVPASVQASAYRILQEALTNAVRYAAPRECTLSLVQSAGALVVTATNPATRTWHSEGYGLLGVRERVTAHGGSMSAGGAADGRFVLRATLPLSTARRP